MSTHVDVHLSFKIFLKQADVIAIKINCFRTFLYIWIRKHWHFFVLKNKYLNFHQTKHWFCKNVFFSLYFFSVNLTETTERWRLWIKVLKICLSAKRLYCLVWLYCHYVNSYFLLCEKCRNKPDVIFKLITAEVSCAHALMTGSLLHTSVCLPSAVSLRVSRHLQAALTAFCFSIRAAKFSAVCAVERFRMRMRSAAGCAAAEL